MKKQKGKYIDEELDENENWTWKTRKVSMNEDKLSPSKEEARRI